MAGRRASAGHQTRPRRAVCRAVHGQDDDVDLPADADKRLACARMADVAAELDGGPSFGLAAFTDLAARTMAIPAEASDPSVATTEFRAIVGALGIAQHRVARLFGVGARSIRRWRAGERRIPCGVDILLRLMVCGAVTIDQIEAVVPIPTRTNGDAKPEPPAPLPGAPAPEQSAAAPAETVALADPDLTTAEKVVALGPGDCRWPCGDPGRADFYFCCSPVTERPYCQHHHALARAAPPTGSRRGVRAAPISHGWRSPTTKRLSTGVSTRGSTDPVGGSVDRSVDESIAAQAQDFRAL
jgi:DNA-binding transcriptional regulator YiaG